MALKGTSEDAATLARELAVSHLVTGSVRRAGNVLRVMAELVDLAPRASAGRPGDGDCEGVPLRLATTGLLHWNDVDTNRVATTDGLDRAAGFAARALALTQDPPRAIDERGLVAGLRGQRERALPVARVSSLHVHPGDRLDPRR